MPQTLGSLANKAKIKFGSLYGAPIIWIKADKTTPATLPTASPS